MIKTQGHISSNQISNYNVYLDVNNIHGYAMSQAIPYTNFKWLEEERFKYFDLHTGANALAMGYLRSRLAVQ